MEVVAKKKSTTQKSNAKAFKESGRIHTSTARFKSKLGIAAKKITPKEFEEYLVYKQLKEEIKEFYPYPGLWLEAPHEMLGGRTPLEIALTGSAGTEIILDLIASIKAGHFS